MKPIGKFIIENEGEWSIILQIAFLRQSYGWDTLDKYQIIIVRSRLSLKIATFILSSIRGYVDRPYPGLKLDWNLDCLGISCTIAIVKKKILKIFIIFHLIILLRRIRNILLKARWNVTRQMFNNRNILHYFLQAIIKVQLCYERSWWTIFVSIIHVAWVI